MKTIRFLPLCLLLFLVTTSTFAQQKIMQPGTQFHGIRDYREVMPGVLYRGQLNALCDEGVGTAIYLYNTQFPGPSTRGCSKGSLDYIYRGWEGRGRAAVHQQIYNAIKNKSQPVFI